jgi:hypothetical protein
MYIGYTHFAVFISLQTNIKSKFYGIVLIGQYPGIFMNLCELLLHVSAKISHFEVNFRYWTCLETDARWSLVSLREGHLLPTF